MSVDAADARVDELAQRSYSDTGEAFAALTETTAIINRAMKSEAERPIAGAGVVGFGGGDIGDRIRNWINKLEEMLRVIAKQFRAMSYSVAVNWPLGVSVSVTWTPS
jgi:hypothetical protein